MPKITAVIITFNEERNIKRCLESIIGVADEILVIDSGSTDKTEEICNLYDVNFIQRKWTGYSDQKNFGNKIAKNDWILSIDADEAISGELRLSILETKPQAEAEVCSFNRLTLYCTKWIKHSGWYPDTKIRLFDRNKAEWTGKIHETLNITSKGKVHHLQGDLLHYSYNNISEHITKMNLFTDLSSEDLLRKGVKSNFFKIIFKVKFKFISTYFIKLGILDGYYGFVIAILSAFSEYLKFTKLQSKQKTQKSG